MKQMILSPGLVSRHCIGLSTVALLGVMCGLAQAQEPVITSFARDGELVAAHLEPGSVAVVEWAPSVEGPWTNTWAGLGSVVVDSNGMIRVRVPTFYRVRGGWNPDLARLAYIPPGMFVMGSPATEALRSLDETPHQVTLTQGIWMGLYEVTQGEYQDVIGSNPSYFRNGEAPFSPGSGGAVTNELEHPVETVSWHDATNYCVRLTEREVMVGRIPVGYRYRLPTESEWEYACRAGTTKAFHYGPALHSGMANFEGDQQYDSAVGTIGNPGGTYLGRTSEVGSYAPNGFGLYDMHGNVWEWCQDWHGTYPGTGVDPQGSVTASFRVGRGGGWPGSGSDCRSANRDGGPPDFRASGIGFRVVLVPGPAFVP